MELINLINLFNTEFPAGSVTDTEKKQWFNDACLDMVRKTYCLKTYALWSAVADQRGYVIDTVAPNFLLVDPDEGVLWQDSADDWHRLEATNQNWLDENLGSSWRNSDNTGDPTRYYLYVHPTSGLMIGFDPITDTSDTDVLRMTYIMKPNILSTNTDVPFSLNSTLSTYHPLIVAYGLWKAKQKRGKFSQAEIFKNEYLTGLVLMRQEVKENPDFRPGWKPDSDYFSWHA